MVKMIHFILYIFYHNKKVIISTIFEKYTKVQGKSKINCNLIGITIVFSLCVHTLIHTYNTL